MKPSDVAVKPLSKTAHLAAHKPLKKGNPIRENGYYTRK
jgi:hypothetical protein